MLSIVNSVVRAHDAVFTALERALAGGVLSLLARLTFGSVLLVFFWQSAYTKLIDTRAGPQGLFDYLTVESSALAQIAPQAFEAVNYDGSQMGVGYWLLAYAGAYGEVLLPLLVFLGLFTRLASLGMIGFILVMSWVDLYFTDQQRAPILAKLPALEQAVTDAEAERDAARVDPDADLLMALEHLRAASGAVTAAEAAIRAEGGPDKRALRGELRTVTKSIEQVNPALAGAERRGVQAVAAARKAVSSEQAKLRKIDIDAIGLPFDKEPDSKIVDQRLLWIFVLLFLVLRGGGAVSIDGLFRGLRDIRGGAV